MFCPVLSLQVTSLIFYWISCWSELSHAVLSKYLPAHLTMKKVSFHSQGLLTWGKAYWAQQEWADQDWSALPRIWGSGIIYKLIESINTSTVIMPSLDYFHTLVSVNIVSLPSCQYLVRCTSQAHCLPCKMVFFVERMYTTFDGKTANLSLVKHEKHSFGSAATSWKMFGFPLQILNTM